jgi:hypothetical protein
VKSLSEIIEAIRSGGLSPEEGDKPAIAVPTSVGFGAGYLAGLINSL